MEKNIQAVTNSYICATMSVKMGAKGVLDFHLIPLTFNGTDALYTHLHKHKTQRKN